MTKEQMIDEEQLLDLYGSPLMHSRKKIGFPRANRGTKVKNGDGEAMGFESKGERAWMEARA